MDLPTVKASVKAWEKAFRAEQGRAPTKEDIKADSGGIKSQYDLYRRLSKEAQGGASSAGSSSSRLTLAPPISHPPSSAASSGAQHASSSAGPSRSTTNTPRVVSASEYPTTPTPNRRRSATGAKRLDPSAQPGQSDPNGRSDQTGQARQLETTEDDVLRRPAKRPASSPQSASRSSFITPKKPRPSYSGPIVDPNPVNPFASTPPRSAPFGAGVTAPMPSSAQSAASTSSSKFVHANSPRKLRELLESNSLRKVRERHADEEITPRTKARLRLTGDFVTPMKDKVPRRRRGERAEVGAEEIGSSSRAKGKEAMRMEDVLSEGDEDEDEEGNGIAGEGDFDEDEFGPSPMKPGLNRTFTELLQSAEEPASMSAKARTSRLDVGGTDTAGKPKAKQKVMEKDKPSSSQRDISSFFGKAKVKATKEAARPAKVTESRISEAVPIPITDADRSGGTGHGAGHSELLIEDDAVDDRLSTPPPPDPALLEQLEHTPSRSARREKMVSFSDDEVDEWDPEGGNVRQKVFITGTKRSARRRGSLSSMSAASAEDAGGVDEDGAADGDGIEDESDDEADAGRPGPDANGDVTIEDETAPDLTNGDTAATPTHSSPRSSTHPPPLPPLLSLLSLRSPPARGFSARMNDLRVKAIFNPADAARLRAAKKGQDIYVAGQVDAEEDEDGDLIDQYQFDGVQADDADAEGDDDWDEDCDGWKRTGLSMDDEEW